MNKLFFTTGIIISLLFFSFVKPVQAHILKIDGSIGAILHIDPEDDPIVGQQAGFFFEFKDKQNKFKPESCDCVFKIIENKKEIYSQDLFKDNKNPSLTSASVTFTFPQRDVYQVEVVGVPTNEVKFQKFTLVYDVRVSRISKESLPQLSSLLSNHVIHYVIVGAGIFLFITIIFLQNIKKPKK